MTPKPKDDVDKLAREMLEEADAYRCNWLRTRGRDERDASSDTFVERVSSRLRAYLASKEKQ